MEVIEFERRSAAPVPRGLGFRAAASLTDLTPPLGTWTAGWGPGLLPRKGVRLVSRLFARVLVLDDGLGERVALITADLHAGSRYVTERIAQLTADDGFDVGRIVLVGAHNHAGPGNLYGSPYYDTFSTSFPWVGGFHRELADDLSERIAEAVRRAARSLEPARVSWGSSTLWGWTANRSLPAAMNNFAGHSDDEARALLSTTPEAPTDLERRFVDPRVQVLAATRSDGSPIGALSTFAAHDALLAREHGVLGADWFGVAQHTAESMLEARRGTKAAFGLAAGAIGDVDPRPPECSLAELIARRQRSLAENLELVHAHGERLGHAMVEAFDRATKSPALERLTVRFAEPRIAEAPVRTDHGNLRMPKEPRIGASTLAGSELGPGLLTEGLRDADPSKSGDPHWPKVDDDFGMRAIRPVLANLAHQPTHLPLRLISVGDVALVGLPGEPTTWLARGLAALVKHREVMIAGTCGDYAGYLTTEAEYELQHYEGASTLWGRYTEAWLRQELEQMLIFPANASAGVARFLVEPFTGTRRTRRAEHHGKQVPRSAPQLEREGDTVRVQGTLAFAPISVCEWGEWLRCEPPLETSEPQVVLDEFLQTLSWSVELLDWRAHAGQRVTVVLDHPDGAGRFEVWLPR